MITCPDCKKEYSDQAPRCVHCGARNPNRMSGGKKVGIVLLVLIGLVVAFLGFGAVVGNTPAGKQQARERNAIATCWDSQAKKSLDPGEQRFVASACEKMEDDYRKKWGHNP